MTGLVLSGSVRIIRINMVCLISLKSFSLRTSAINTLKIGTPLITAAAVLTLLHSERPKLYAILAFLSSIGLNSD